MARVVLANLSKTFPGPKGEGIRAVQQSNLTVEDGAFLVIVGPSGCGKSTTLRLIAGLETPTAGTISINGTVMNQVDPKDRDVAMVFQHGALYPHLNVFDNMALGLVLRKFPRDEIDRRVKTAAETLGLTSCLSRRPQALSGGQRQRVAVGRAIVRRPKVFLFDEPLSNLDAPLRAQMRVEILKLHRELGATMIYVTHDQVEAMTMADRLVVMREGVIQQVAPPHVVYEQPANVWTARFLGSPPMNLFPGRLLRQAGALTFHAGSGTEANGLCFGQVVGEMAARLAVGAAREVLLGVRPEDIHLGPPGEDTVLAAVLAVERLGAECHVHLRAGGHEFTARAAGRTEAKAKQRIPVSFDLSKAHFFDPTTEKSLWQAGVDLESVPPPGVH